MIMRTDVLIKGGLTVLPHYIECNFNQWRTPGVGGACLLMQLGAIWHRTLGVGHKAIQKSLSKHVKRMYSAYGQGWPLAQSLRPFERLSPWRVKGVIKHDLESGIGALHWGMPLLFVHDRNLICEHEETWDGFARLNPFHDRLSMNSGYNHSLLVIGADADQRCLIARESRPQYATHNGMLKMNVNRLRQLRNGWCMFELVFDR